MKRKLNLIAGPAALTEMKEFGSFSKGAQRYIRRSLDIALMRRDPQIWARDIGEAASVRAQMHIYEMLLNHIRASVPKDTDIRHLQPMIGHLITLAAFDLNQGRLLEFGAFRFLYERMIGARIRPWLPGVYCAAAALPHIAPDARKKMLQNISEQAATAASWSTQEPRFFPEWVEKVERYTPSSPPENA